MKFCLLMCLQTGCFRHSYSYNCSKFVLQPSAITSHSSQSVCCIKQILFGHHKNSACLEADSVKVLTCWTENIFLLTDGAATDPDHRSRKWAEDLPLDFLIALRHFSLSSEADNSTQKNTARRRSVSGHSSKHPGDVITGSGCIFWFRSVNIAVTRSLFWV